MKDYTIYDIKRMAKEYGFHFYQGKGYCYFFPVDDNDVLFYSDSVAICKWHHDDLNFWERELIWKIQNELSFNNCEIYENSQYWKHYEERAKTLQK